MPKNAFPYPGNKARHSEWIIQHIPEHTCYVEPFGGAAGVLFNKPKSKNEVYNDVDGDLVHFFKVLRERPEELQEWLKRVPFSRSLWKEWVTEYYDDHRPDDDIERAGRCFYLRYTQFGGRKNGSQGFATAKQGSSKARAFSNKVDALDWFAKRLRGVVLEALDWREIIDRYDGENTVFYCDPPYLGTEEKYYGTEFDHRELYRRLSDLEGRCLLSYDSIPHFYGDSFQVVTKDSTFNIDNANFDYSDQKEATEYLIMNFDSDGEPLMSDVGQQGLDAFSD